MAAPSFLCCEPVYWRADRERAFSCSSPGWIGICSRACLQRKCKKEEQMRDVEIIHDDPK
jgi:hypothetical protein